jgi:hypothetical protein
MALWGIFNEGGIDAPESKRQPRCSRKKTTSFGGDLRDLLIPIYPLLSGPAMADATALQG